MASQENRWAVGGAIAGGRDDGDGHEDVVRRLQVVTEELAVADDEMAAQQREIDDLLARAEDHGRVVSAITRSVPVPVLLTDAVGSVVEANPAAAALMGVPEGRLVRKPVQALVAPEDRPAVRTLVSRAVAEGSAEAVVPLTPRQGTRQKVRIAVTSAGRRPDRRPALTWVLSSETSDVGSGHGVLQAVAALAALPVGDVDTHGLLVRIAGLATRAVAGGSWSSVALGDPADPVEVATDSAQAQLVDGAQFAAGEGPSVTAYRENTLVVAGDLTADERWPRLARSAAGTPARSALALPIRATDEVSGVLTVFGAEAHTLGDEQEVGRAVVFAEAAAAILRDRQHIDELRSTADHLKAAMQSRASIEQAKGLVAGWLGCPVEEAFAVLSRISQDRNVKVRDIAGLVITDPSRRDLLPLLQETRRRVLGARQAASN